MTAPSVDAIFRGGRRFAREFSCTLYNVVDRDENRPAPTDEEAAEDFLFHLHRGTELLQDNRVHAAKAELEQALSLQPSDPKGQDLLGIVYFRLGLYPRAISIYERLIHSHPEAIEPRINLALCYLKTGQPAQARGELEKVLEQNPGHQRAWGYLGLAHQRLGDHNRAIHAFAVGGHEAMARRLAEMAGASPSPPPSFPILQTIIPIGLEAVPPPAPGAPGPALPRDTAVAAAGGSGAAPDPLEDEMRRAAAEASRVLDHRGFVRDSDLPRIPTGTWSALEPGREELAAMPTLREPLELSLRQPPLPDVPSTISAPPPPPAPPGFGPLTKSPPASLPATRPNQHNGQPAPRKPSTTLTAGEVSPPIVSQPPVAVRGSVLAHNGDTSTIPTLHTAGSPAGSPPPLAATPSLQPAQGRTSLPQGAQPLPHGAQQLPPTAVTQPPPSTPEPPALPPSAPLAFARDRLLVFPRDLTLSQHPSGLVLVQAKKGFAARLNAARSLAITLGVPTQVLTRRSRGRDQDEPLGGAVAPIYEIGGRCELVLVPPDGLRLSPLMLADDPLYLREDALIGFELQVTYENGRLPSGDGEAIPLVQLRGKGGVVCALPSHAVTIEIQGGRTTIVHASMVRGWIGRILPRALSTSEAPASLRGMVAFSGEGMVIVDGH
ncbi:tetratricopeptide repeat protein [Chondromyces crocatus]|uniref:tetratricopeptide repeat protein n=1 Tax=Chondromyces crocatus TaxID=52 RepID=UPI001FDFDFCA|nr:tetratricopeptide repeat protein [Chondromyces crocatus]